MEKDGIGDEVAKATLSPNLEDSIADFKSPKAENVVQAGTSRQKITKDNRVKKSGTAVKKKSSSNKKTKNVVAQPSIESSFFKTTNTGNKVGHTCPICMKHFADTKAGAGHTKNCAEKNQVSSEKLLAAVELHERQALERIAMGLPVGPVGHSKKKTLRRNHAPVLKEDSDLQLAMALSESLQQTELKNQFEEAMLLVNEHQSEHHNAISSMTESQRRLTLRNFGFSTNKPTTDGALPTGSSRTKKRRGPTILQTRTQEARDRILSDKIAEILMNNAVITQVCPESFVTDEKPVVEQPTVLKSGILKTIHQSTTRLWNSADLSEAVTNFYVEELGSVIIPVIDADAKNSAVCVPECDNSDGKNQDEKEVSPCASKNASPRLERSKSEETMNSTSDEIKNINLPDCPVTIVPITSKINQEYINILSTNWANMLNVSSMSDVVVIVKNNHIWAHKLVLHVRCSDILLDCKTNDDAKFSQVADKILWLDTDFLAGLAFLEFVYSGAIVKNIHAFSNSRVVTEIRHLAEKYRLKDLVDYLQRCQVEIDHFIVTDMQKSRNLLLVKNETDESKEPERCSDDQPTSELIKDDHELFKTSPCKKSEELAITKMDISSDEHDEEITSAVAINSPRTRVSMSPDLFDDTVISLKDSEESSSEEKSEENDQSPSNENSNLKVLADLIANDDLSSFNDTNEKSMLSRSTSKDLTQKNSSQIQIETPRSREASIGTDIRKSSGRSLSQRLIEKPKSKLSLFIEKVQKINAISASESFSDDDEEFVGKVSLDRRVRNPFRVDTLNGSSMLNYSQEFKRKSEQSRINEKKKEIKDKTIHNFSQSTIANEFQEECGTSDSTIATDYENMSMYSKYKKNHKQNNSIRKYRKILNRTIGMNSNSSDDDEKSNNSKSLNEKSIDLTQDSDTEKEMISTPSSNSSRLQTPKESTSDLNEAENSKIPAKNSGKSPNVGENEVSEIDEQLFADSWKYSQILSNESTTGLSSRSFAAADDFVSFRRKRKLDKEKTKINEDRTISVNNFIKDNAEVESKGGYISSEDIKGFDDAFEYRDAEIFGTNNELRTRRSSSRSNSSNCSLSTEEKSVSTIDSVSFIDDLENDENEALQQCFDRSLENVISPTKSPEYPDPEIFEANNEILTQSFINSNFSPNKRTKLASNHSPTIEQNDDHISSNLLRVPSPIVLSSSPEYCLDTETGFAGKEQDFNKENSFAAEHNLNPRKTKTPEPRASTSRQEYSPACKVNSTRRGSNSLIRWNSMPTSKSNYERSPKIHRTPSTSTRIVLSQDVTPPVNYNTMDTPELKRELEKYGIKPQKRNRARQLLTHIYNELHPLVPDSEAKSLTADRIITSNNDGEPPSKKAAKSKKRTTDDSESDLEIPMSQDSIASAASLIPEEMVFPDEDLSSDEISGATNIKQAFLALIKLDKELHNKLLTYEPLPLEPLYSALKADGFKCKLNDLMDFLDEECITFQVQGQSNKRKNNKARGKKTASSGTRKANSQKK